MAEVKNTLARQEQAVSTTDMKVSQYFGQESVKKMLKSTLGNEKLMQRFVADVIAAASVNPDLQDCDKGSVLSGALLANSMQLSVAPSLGLCYLVPFKDKKAGQKRAVFVVGYRGLLQLAMRSGYYKDIDAFEVREGEYLGRDADTGKPRFKFVEDDVARNTLPVVGYMAYFEYLNGFKKVLYWSKEQMIQHADTYSAAFSKNAVTGKYPKLSFADYEAGKVPADEMWKYSSFWYKEFDSMAKKTMLRQLISKWGVMSVEMQNAFENDKDEDADPDIGNDDIAADILFGQNEVHISPDQYSVDGQDTK